jgi:hypothetical protein
MSHDDIVVFVREILSEANRTQDRRLRTFTNDITKSIMALYSGRNPNLSFSKITAQDLNVSPNTKGDEIYEIEAGIFPLNFDPGSIDTEEYEEGVDPFITVVVEIDKSAEKFNVSASDKNITGIADLGIHVAIETPSKFLGKNMGVLRNEIANAVRHELEHVTQGTESDQPARAFARGKKYYTFLHRESDVDSPYAKYLLRPSEIPAHVRGYAQNAKNAKDLSEDINDLLDGYLKQKIILPKEKDIILNTWIDWTKNHINRKGF